jgi:hypothetical protein
MSLGSRNLDTFDHAVVDAHSEDEFFRDLVRVTGGRLDEELARMVVRQSSDCPARVRTSRQSRDRSLTSPTQVSLDVCFTAMLRLTSATGLALSDRHR